MKKLSLTALFYCLLGLVFYSCCTDEYRIIGSSELIIDGSKKIDSISILPVVTGTFKIEDIHFTEVASNMKAEFGTQSAYAVSCELNLVSEVQNVELYFDQPLTLDGATVLASTNLLADATFSEHISFVNEGYNSASTLYISLDGTFFNPPIFTNGPMNIRLRTILVDGSSFDSETDVFVNM